MTPPRKDRGGDPAPRSSSRPGTPGAAPVSSAPHEDSPAAPAAPAAPAGLHAAGTALWERLTAAYEFGPTESALLEAACRQADDVALIEAAIAQDGAVVAGSKGQPRLNAGLAEVRQGRLALQKLLGGLAVPEDDEAPLTANGRRARAAANARWDRRRAEEAQRGSSSN